MLVIRMVTNPLRAPLSIGLNPVISIAILNPSQVIPDLNDLLSIPPDVLPFLRFESTWRVALDNSILYSQGPGSSKEGLKEEGPKVHFKIPPLSTHPVEVCLNQYD